MAANLLHHRLANILRVGVGSRESLDFMRAEIRRHDDHGVAEIHCAPLTIGHASIVEHLQQHVEDVGMGFLDLVEQDHAVGFTAHRFGEIAPFFVTDVARRGTNESGHRVFFHKFTHVDANHAVFAIEQEAG